MRHTVNRQKVVLEHFDDETILINMQTCVYYSLNRSGCEVWKLVEDGHDAAAITATLSRRYAVDETQLAPQIEALLTQLVGEGLLEPASSSSSDAPLPPVAARRTVEPFAAPQLSRYNDMQDLLLLDPIHDVDELGWPNARPQALAGGK